LVRAHHIQVVVRPDLEHSQHLIQHLAVLSRDAHFHVEFIRPSLHVEHDGTQLDSLWPRAKNEEYALAAGL